MEKIYFYKTPVTYGVIDLDEPKLSVAKVVTVLTVITVLTVVVCGLAGFVAGI